MSNQPTVIVLAHALRERAATGSPQAEGSPFGALQATLHRVLASELPMVLVAPPHITEQARGLLPGNSLVNLPQAMAPQGGETTQALTAGVHASAHANGWLLLPAGMPMLKPQTLQRVAQGLLNSLIAYPQYRAQRGQPMGFGRELFSELISLVHDRDLQRLISRYPSEGIDVDDPGVTMDPPMPAAPPAWPTYPGVQRLN